MNPTEEESVTDFVKYTNKELTTSINQVDTQQVLDGDQLNKVQFH